MATKTKKQETKPNFIPYEKRGEVALKVPGFDGTDKATQNAKAALAISRYLTVNKKADSFTSNDARQVVLEQTNVDLAGFYPGSSYSDSPLHKGLNALSKPETGEVLKDKDGNEYDSVARGARAILKKTGKVGLCQTGRYYRNTSKSYDKWFEKITPAELKSECDILVANSRANKK